MSFYSPEQGHVNLRAEPLGNTWAWGATNPSFPKNQSVQGATEADSGEGVSRVGSAQARSYTSKNSNSVISTTRLLPPNSPTNLLSNPLSCHLPPIYFTLDSAGVVQAVDFQGAAGIGYSIEALIGQSVTVLFHPQDQLRLRTELIPPPTNGSTKRGVFRLICHDGRVVQQFVTVQFLQTMAEPMLLLICNCTESELEKPSALNSESPGAIEVAERLQAQQILRQQTEWETLMQAIVQPVRQGLGLRVTLRAVATEVRQILQADRVLVYQAQPDQSGSVLAEALAPGCCSVFKQARVISLLQQKFTQLEGKDPAAVIFHADDNALSRIDEPSVSLLGVYAEVVIPIMQQDDLWGLLIVHQCRQSPLWQAWEVGLLKQVATYLDGVIHQVELYQKVHRLNADLERQIQARTAQLELAFEFEATLKRITDKVRDSLDENQILETVVQEVACAIGISCCNASMYDLETGTSTIFYEYTTTISPYQGRSVQLDAFPEIYDQLLEGQAFQFCSLVVNPERGKVAMLTCPIVDDQGVLGDLWLINHPFYCFSEQDIRLVQQVANQCAIAIRQARLYQAAQAQVEELERLNRLKDDFLSTVSHELRTPMANIKMATQMLGVILKQVDLLDGDDPKVGRYFQILQAECQREINLINDLLDLSRLDTEQTPPELVTIDLKTWLPAIVQPFVERAENHHQKIVLNGMAHVPLVTMELSSLERILAELLQNACKYTPAGETITIAARLQESFHTKQPKLLRGSAQPSVSVSSPSSSHLLQIRVTNSGTEIPPQELSRIFEKFYRIPSSDRWQHGGTGLGLALVKKLAERLGGDVWAESSSGQTRFTLELPISVLPNSIVDAKAL